MTKGTPRPIDKIMGHAFGTQANPLLVDQAADADLARLLGRLRSVPGSNKGNANEQAR